MRAFASENRMDISAGALTNENDAKPRQRFVLGALTSPDLEVER